MAEHPIAKRLVDDELLSLNTVKSAAILIDDYQAALQQIIQAKTLEEAYLIAYTALM